MAISFQQVMDFKPAHNEAVYEEIKANIGQLLPYVGAGLTATFYGTWPSAIRALGEYLEPSELTELTGLLDSGKYLDAAQYLEDKLGKNNLEQNLIRHFSEQKLTDNWGLVQQKAIYLLPLLFKRPIITTNFDEALERVYEDHGIDFKSLGPTSDELVSTATKLMNTPCVFKLHGTVTGKMMDYDGLVFTKAQYERCYGTGGPIGKAGSKLFPQLHARSHPVVNALRRFASGRSLLFLGCSLDKDRTLEVLEQAGTKGGSNYAIVSCKPEERAERLRQLDKLRIRAILYEDGRHESVRVILEQLLKDLSPSDYQALSHKASALSSPAFFNPYVYDSGLTPLYGRDAELDDLKQFVTSTKNPFCWWALTGPGGSGKSRLALELQTSIDNMPGWHAHKLTTDDYRDLKSYFDALPHSNTLVIADYVQAHARELGERMQSLVESAPTSRVRLLLVEREGTSLDYSESQTGWQSQLFENVHHKSDVKDRCWSKQFLSLKPLTDSDLVSIIESFADGLQRRGIAKRRIPTDGEKTLLIDRLHSIDEGLCRPLYVLFLTGALMDDSDLTRWDKEKVLDHITTRECERIDTRIRHIEGRSTSNRAAWRNVLHLYRLATVIQGGDLELIRTLCVDAWDKLSKVATDSGLDGVEELLGQIGLLDNNMIKPMEPDLIGEYFVYSWLCTAKPTQRKGFLSQIWTQSLAASHFIDQLFSDYDYLLNKDSAQWLWFLPTPEPPWLPTTHLGLYVRAMLLTNMTARCSDASVCYEIVGRIEALHDDFPNDREVALRLAQGLFNLSSEQDAAAEATVGRIQALHDDFPGDREVALVLVLGLFSLSSKQDAAAAEATVGRIQALLDGLPGDREVALRLAQGLFNLSNKQDAAAAEATVGRIEALLSDFPGDREVALVLAQGLVNLSNKQDAAAAAATVGRIEALLSIFPRNREVALVLAQGLFNLSSEQDAAAAEATVGRIEALLSVFPGDREVALELAKGLVNLSCEQGAEEAEATVGRIEALLEAFPGDREVALVLAQGLVNLFIMFKYRDMNETKAFAILGHLMMLNEEYSGLVPELRLLIGDQP